MSHYVLAMEPPPIIRQLDLEAYSTGAGPDVVSVQQTAHVLSNVYRESSALTYREAALTEAFSALTEQWRKDTRFDSSLTEITEHPAYRAIVALGDEIVPLLLHELRRRDEPELWFTALREITRADPVPVDHWGDLRAMADDWLRWGREHRLIR